MNDLSQRLQMPVPTKGKSVKEMTDAEYAEWRQGKGPYAVDNFEQCIQCYDHEGQNIPDTVVEITSVTALIQRLQFRRKTDDLGIVRIAAWSGEYLIEPDGYSRRLVKLPIGDDASLVKSLCFDPPKKSTDVDSKKLANILKQELNNIDDD